MATLLTSLPEPSTKTREPYGYTAGYLPVNVRLWRRLWSTIWRVLLVSLGIAVVVNPDAWHSPRHFAINFAFTVVYTAGLWLTNGGSVDWLNKRVPWTEQPGRRLLLTVLLSLVGSLVVIMLVNMLFWRFYFHLPMSDLFSRRLMNQIVVPLLVTIFFSLTMHARSFLLGWRDAAVKTQRLEKETAVARLDSLRRQVDPHFLFNSLNALTSLVEENDPARAVRFIRQLSQVYRYVLDSQSQELVPLAEEVRFAESYLFLQKTRLGDALAVEMDLPAAALQAFFLPPLALQLLLENVIKHNTAFQTNPLRVTVTLDPAAQTLTVRNTLRPRRLAPGEASGLGLKNLTARYAFLTSKPLAIGEDAGEFIVTLPLLTMNNEQ